MIRVSIPATVPLKEFDYNAEVELINPIANTVANATFQGADVDWFIKADDIVLIKAVSQQEIHRITIHSHRVKNKRYCFAYK